MSGGWWGASARPGRPKKLGTSEIRFSILRRISGRLHSFFENRSMVDFQRESGAEEVSGAGMRFYLHEEVPRGRDLILSTRRSCTRPGLMLMGGDVDENGCFDGGGLAEKGSFTIIKFIAPCRKSWWGRSCRKKQFYNSKMHRACRKSWWGR